MRLHVKRVRMCRAKERVGSPMRSGINSLRVVGRWLRKDGALRVEDALARGSSQIFHGDASESSLAPSALRCPGMRRGVRGAARGTMQREDNARCTFFGRPKRCTTP